MEINRDNRINDRDNFNYDKNRYNKISEDGDIDNNQINNKTDYKNKIIINKKLFKKIENINDKNTEENENEEENDDNDNDKYNNKYDRSQNIYDKDINNQKTKAKKRNFSDDHRRIYKSDNTNGESIYNNEENIRKRKEVVKNEYYRDILDNNDEDNNYNNNDSVQKRNKKNNIINQQSSQSSVITDNKDNIKKKYNIYNEYHESIIKKKNITKVMNLIQIEIKTEKEQFIMIMMIIVKILKIF